MPNHGRAYRIATKGLLAYWRRHDRTTWNPPTFSMNLSDNVQVPMNLVMPLADKSPVGCAEMVEALAGAVEEIMAGLNNTGIVHFARFTIVDGNLCMFSMYDGDFSNYIRDFIYNIGEAFDAIMTFVENPPHTPVEEHPDEFIAWVEAHDLLRLPEAITDLSDDMLKLPRRLAILLDAQPNVQLMTYRAFPGFSAAQIRHALGIGW